MPSIVDLETTLRARVFGALHLRPETATLPCFWIILGTSLDLSAPRLPYL